MAPFEASGMTLPLSACETVRPTWRTFGHNFLTVGLVINQNRLCAPRPESHLTRRTPVSQNSFKTPT